MSLMSGVTEGVPYSLSRWTDVPASKWSWFESCLQHSQMVAFDPRTSVPSVWSLQPEDTLGLVFWTKNPTNLVRNKELLKPYDVTVHVTATGWSEVEKGAPTLEESGELLFQTAKAFKTVYWRFSPIPQLPERELLIRFQRLLGYASVAGLRKVFVSFLQSNDRVPETRGATERFELLNSMADEAKAFGIDAVLCGDDHSFDDFQGAKFSLGPCVNPVDFHSQHPIHLENCGCVLMVDPFTVNEACQYGCSYCYAADRSLSKNKRNTTRLTVVR
jgi:hypothetical protein